MKKRILAAVAVLAAAGMLLTGCNNNGGSDPGSTGTSQTTAAASSEAVGIADKYFAGGADSYTAWKDTDRSALIATVPEGTEGKEYFYIPLGEFLNEYMY